MLFRTGVACMILVAILDIVVSAALYRLFTSVHRDLAAYRSGFVPRVFGVLLAIAGLGYLADGVGSFSSPTTRAVSRDLPSSVRSRSSSGC